MTKLGLDEATQQKVVAGRPTVVSTTPSSKKPFLRVPLEA